MADSKHDNHGDQMPAHELSDDVRIGGVVWFIALLAVAVVFIAWLMVALFNSLEGKEKKAEIESRPSPFASERAKLPPEPRLQLAPNSEEQIDKHEEPNLKTQHPLQEMKDLRKSWDSQLNHYSWADEKAGIVRIPIEEAKKLLLERGLPTKAARPAAAAPKVEESKEK